MPATVFALEGWAWGGIFLGLGDKFAEIITAELIGEKIIKLLL